jgi:hypothetical protein
MVADNRRRAEAAQIFWSPSRAIVLGLAALVIFIVTLASTVWHG